MISEDLLHYVWKYGLFSHKKLKTSAAESITIVSAGQHNTNGGPDFSNARIKIGDTTWAGNVEIHTKSSDWNKHNHHNDKAYDNIILHVIYTNDTEIKRADNTIIPSLELQDLIDNNTILCYNNLMRSKSWIPCENLAKKVNAITISAWYNRLLIERFERKSSEILNTLKLNKNNWDQTFFQHLAINFGFKLNSVPFELLAKSIPLAAIAKHSSNLNQIEALLFGQAGMLEKTSEDPYFLQLKEEYHFLKNKFNLTPLKEHLWKFLRLNPAGFPTIRIAQFAMLIYSSKSLFSQAIEEKHIGKYEEMFDVSCSEYWYTHYIFGKNSPKRFKKLGKSAIDNIIINTIVPFIFTYGITNNDEQAKERAIQLLDQVQAEKNAIVTKLKFLGFPGKTAADSQALLEMRNNYCVNKMCLNCGVGIDLLKN